MEDIFIPIKKSRIALYIIIFIFLLGVTIALHILDKQQNSLWDILTYICIVFILYLIYIYAKDLFNKKAGICIKNNGIYLNLEYYKDIHVSREDITDIKFNRYTFSVHVKDAEEYLEQIPKFRSILIRGNIKRTGTLFIIRNGQLHCTKEELTDKFKKALQEYKNKE